MIEYRVLKECKFLDYKMSYDIEVDLIAGCLPTKEELAEIAVKLRSKKHERTFVCFYLPGMTLDAGAFATGHHNPELKVRLITVVGSNYARS